MFVNSNFYEPFLTIDMIIIMFSWNKIERTTNELCHNNTSIFHIRRFLHWDHWRRTQWFCTHIYVHLYHSQVSKSTCPDYKDVMTWRRFPYYWPMVREIHQSPVDYPQKGPVMRFFMFSLLSARNKMLKKEPKYLFSIIKHCLPVIYSHRISQLSCSSAVDTCWIWIQFERFDRHLSNQIYRGNQRMRGHDQNAFLAIKLPPWCRKFVTKCTPNEPQSKICMYLTPSLKLLNKESTFLI